MSRPQHEEAIALRHEEGSSSAPRVAPGEVERPRRVLGKPAGKVVGSR